MKPGMITRRSAVFGGLSIFVLLLLGGGSKYLLPSGKKQIRPPGGQNEADLLGACIRCDRCRQVCPMDVIESATVEDGFMNIGLPKLNFRTQALERTLGTTQYHKLEKGYCNFCDPDQLGNQAKKCVANCPTGALKNFDETKEYIGKAIIDPNYCICFPHFGQSPTGCRVCVDECPYEAIYLNDNARPEVIWDKCNGCGKCELVCPSASYRQIIGVDTLKEKAEEGIGTYADSYKFYLKTGKIPRGINVLYEEDFNL